MISAVNLLKNNTELTVFSWKVSRIKIIRTGIISCFREKLKPWTVFDGAAKIWSQITIVVVWLKGKKELVI